MLNKYFNLIKFKWLPPVFARFIKIIIRLILKTCQCNIYGLEHLKKSAESSPCILMLWHNRLLPVAEILNRYAPEFIYTAFISNSRDGHPLSLMALSYPAGRVLRVPHNARRRALKTMIATLKHPGQVVVITPDGPRGPRYFVKPGVCLAARKSSAPVIPFSWESNKFWQLETWDQMRIPKPFSTIDIIFGNPLKSSKENKRKLAEDSVVFQSALQNCHQKKL